jgi:long-chain fatty acid transport protein
MMLPTFRFHAAVVIVLLLIFAAVNPSANAQGVFLRAAGAVNESVAGVATAMPIDGSGALYWNPATISALKKSEISLGMGIILPESKVSSSIPAIAGTAGSTESEAGATPVPGMSFIWRRCPKSPVTYGLGMSAVGGAASLYPSTGSVVNPILGGRSKSATVIIMQITPTVSYQVTEKLSVGVAPVIDLASLAINPMQLGQPVGADDEIHNYGTRYAWGGGFQIGTYYDFKNHFKTGFMFKSPVWAENISFEGTKVTGAPPAPVSGSFDLNLPMILSAGVSYDGIKDTIIGLDVRYFDYANTTGFKDGVVGGKVMGLDWDSIFAVAIGVEHKLNGKWKVRTGYCWNENPIPSRSSYLNVAAPMMIQHLVSVGATYAIVKDLEFSFAYTHAFKAAVSGQFHVEPNIVGNVTNEVSADTFNFGITKKW